MAKQTDPVSLTTKLSKAADRLQLRYGIHNGGEKAILVFNRLWAGESGRQVDPQKVYRFVSGHGLILLLGSAPLPDSPVTFRNLPEVVKIESHSDFEEELSILAPITEYNIYFSKAPATERASTRIDTVELFIEYVDAAGVETMPSRTHPGAFWTTNSAAMTNYRTLRSGPIALQLDVLRQTGEYARFSPTR